MDVELDGIRMDRDGRPVLALPSLRLRGARTTAVLGPNGSGKTTLLRLIAGLERPRSGRIRFTGAPSSSHSRVAFVFQEQVFLRRSVRDNLELGLRLRGVDASQRRERIAHATALLGIGDLLERRADRLSGGEGKRVSLARALCLRSPLVLLDEPLEGLDESTYIRLLDDLPHVLPAFEATTILVTHNRHEALRLADDLVILVDGQVQAAGEKHAVATNPRSAALAEILGYTVLPVGERRIAVPAGALLCGPGRLQFSLDVEQIVDLVERREIIGRVAGRRVRVTLPAGHDAPRVGETLLVHPHRHCDLPPA